MSCYTFKRLARGDCSASAGVWQRSWPERKRQRATKSRRIQHLDKSNCTRHCRGICRHFPSLGRLRFPSASSIYCTIRLTAHQNHSRTCVETVHVAVVQFAPPVLQIHSRTWMGRYKGMMRRVVWEKRRDTARDCPHVVE